MGDGYIPSPPRNYCCEARTHKRCGTCAHGRDHRMETIDEEGQMSPHCTCCLTGRIMRFVDVCAEYEKAELR